MSYEDKDDISRTLDAAVPIPPSDWTGLDAVPNVEALIAAHQHDLARYLRRRAPSQDVGDLAQESIGRLLAKPRHALALIEKSGAYLIRIARNLLTDRARSAEVQQRARHHSFEDAEVAGPDPHAVLEARETLRRVERAIERLKPQTGSIFVMHRFDGLSYAEIAEAKGITVKGVEWHIAKAMAAIDKARVGHK